MIKKRTLSVAANEWSVQGSLSTRPEKIQSVTTVTDKGGKRGEPSYLHGRGERQTVLCSEGERGPP